VRYFFAVALVAVAVLLVLFVALLHWVAVVDCNCLLGGLGCSLVVAAALQLFARWLGLCFVSPVGDNQAIHKALWPANNDSCTALKVSGFSSNNLFFLIPIRDGNPALAPQCERGEVFVNGGSGGTPDALWLLFREGK
jgi:hypothetical protein